MATDTRNISPRETLDAIDWLSQSSCPRLASPCSRAWHNERAGHQHGFQALTHPRHAQPI